MIENVVNLDSSSPMLFSLLCPDVKFQHLVSLRLLCSWSTESSTVPGLHSSVIARIVCQANLLPTITLANNNQLHLGPPLLDTDISYDILID